MFSLWDWRLKSKKTRWEIKNATNSTSFNYLRNLLRDDKRKEKKAWKFLQQTSCCFASSQGVFNLYKSLDYTQLQSISWNNFFFFVQKIAHVLQKSKNFESEISIFFFLFIFLQFFKTLPFPIYIFRLNVEEICVCLMTTGDHAGAAKFIRRHCNALGSRGRKVFMFFEKKFFVLLSK